MAWVVCQHGFRGVNGVQCERRHWGSEEPFTFSLSTHNILLLPLPLPYCSQMFSYLTFWILRKHILFGPNRWKPPLLFYWVSFSLFKAHFNHIWWKSLKMFLISLGGIFYGNRWQFLPQYSCFWNAPLSATKWLMAKLWPNPQYLHQKQIDRDQNFRMPKNMKMASICTKHR